MEPWIQTRHGVAFDLANPTEDMVRIDDIAYALSRIVRYCGHVPGYTVAKHSLIMSYQVEPRLALWALLHDAHEAYVGDVSAPVKSLLPDYRALEKRIATVVRARFGLDAEMPEEIKIADRRMLATEQRAFFPQQARDWGLRGVEPYRINLYAEQQSADGEAWLFVCRFNGLVDLKATS